MCLTTEAFALFLNLISAGHFTHDGPAVTIHATAGDVTWHKVVDDWCTAAPYGQGQLPFMVAAEKQPFTMR